MWIVSMRFKTTLSEDKLEELSLAGVPKFRALPGLQQKNYVRNHATGEWGGVYEFESEEAAENYVNGPIVASVGERFGVEGDVKVEVLEVVLNLDE